MSERRESKYRQQGSAIIEELSYEDEFFNFANSNNIGHAIEMNDDGLISVKEHLLHVNSLSSHSQVESFWKMFFLVLRKYNVKIVFLEIALILPDHVFSDFDEDDWNEKWNNSATQQFLPRSVQDINIIGDVSSSKCSIRISENQGNFFDDVKDIFGRYGYLQDETRDYNIKFPVNRIRSLCFRVMGKK